MHPAELINYGFATYRCALIKRRASMLLGRNRPCKSPNRHIERARSTRRKIEKLHLNLLHVARDLRQLRAFRSRQSVLRKRKNSLCAKTLRSRRRIRSLVISETILFRSRSFLISPFLPPYSRYPHSIPFHPNFRPPNDSASHRLLVST